MKVCIIQPKYEMDHTKTADISAWILDALDRCDETMDVIVLPESSDIPCFAKDEDEMLQSYAENNRRAAWNLMQSILNGDKLLADIDSAVHSLEMIVSIYQSAVARSPKQLPLKDRKHPLR